MLYGGEIDELRRIRKSGESEDWLTCAISTKKKKIANSQWQWDRWELRSFSELGRREYYYYSNCPINGPMDIRLGSSSMDLEIWAGLSPYTFIGSVLKSAKLIYNITIVLLCFFSWIFDILFFFLFKITLLKFLFIDFKKKKKIIIHRF